MHILVFFLFYGRDSGDIAEENIKYISQFYK